MSAAANGSNLLVFSCPASAIFLPTKTSRRLGHLSSSDSSGGDGYSATLATMAGTTTQYYKTDYTVLSTSNSSVGARSGLLFAGVGAAVVLLLLLLLFVFIEYRPSKSARKKQKELSADESSEGGNRVFRRMGATFHVQMNFSVHSFSSECWLIEQSMPYVFNRAVNLTYRVLHMFTTHHRWFRLAAHGPGNGNGQGFWSAIFPSGRAIALTAAVSERITLALHVVVFFFFQCLLLFSLDGESACSNIYNEGVCSATVSASLSGDNICHWNVYAGATSDKYGYCSYIRPDRRPNTLTFIALYSAVCALPIGALNDFIIGHVIIFPYWIRTRYFSDSEDKLVDAAQSNQEEFPPIQDHLIESAPMADLDSVASADYTINYPHANKESSTYNPNRSILSAITFNRSLSMEESENYSVSRNRSGYSVSASVFQEKSFDEYSQHFKGEVVLQTLVPNITL